MANRPALFTQADVARALRAVKQVGVPAVVEITRERTIRIVPIDPDAPRPPESPAIDEEAGIVL